MKTMTLILASLLVLGAIAAPVSAEPNGFGTCHIEWQYLSEPITVGPVTFQPGVPQLVCYW